MSKNVNEQWGRDELRPKVRFWHKAAVRFKKPDRLLLVYSPAEKYIKQTFHAQVFLLDP